MLRNLHLWRSTIKINGRMYIIGSDVKCGVCGKEHYNAIELKWHKAKFHQFKFCLPAFLPSCPILQVNFDETEINWYVKKPPFMTINNKNQWENVHNRVRCEMWNVWKGTLHCNWVELTQSKISWIQILPSGQAASLYRLIFMRQK